MLETFCVVYVIGFVVCGLVGFAATTFTLMEKFSPSDLGHCPGLVVVTVGFVVGLATASAWPLFLAGCFWVFIRSLGGAMSNIQKCLRHIVGDILGDKTNA